MYSNNSREFAATEENLEEVDNELPAAGLEEPLEAIRKLGAQQPDVSCAFMNFGVSTGLIHRFQGSPMPRARARSVTPSRNGQDRKRRKLSHGVAPSVKHEFPDGADCYFTRCHSAEYVSSGDEGHDTGNGSTRIVRHVCALYSSASDGL